MKLWKWKCSLLSGIQPCMTPWTVAHQAPLFMGFARQEYQIGVAISFSRGSFQLSNQTWVSCIIGRFFTVWATREMEANSCENWINKKAELNIILLFQYKLYPWAIK